MLKTYSVDHARLLPLANSAAADAIDWTRVYWADLLKPTKDEEAAIETWIGVDVPTREEMEEIEISSRLYVEDGAHFMTAIVPALGEGDVPEMGPVTFILSGQKLVTIRYHEPRAFNTFQGHAEKAALGCTSGSSILIGLLETIVDRLADILERASRDVETISKDIFNPTATKASHRDRNFQRLLKDLGRKETLTSDIRDSLTTFQRMFSFLANAFGKTKHEKVLGDRVKTLSRDVSSLASHAEFLSQKITFLLDATLGMIGIEQNNIIKIVSVATLVFLPPTLVASIYGMNFEFMPELHWAFGYPLALGLMVLFAILPFMYFRGKGWL